MQDNISPEEKLLNLIKKGPDNAKNNINQPKTIDTASNETEGPPVKAKVPAGIPRKTGAGSGKSFTILNKLFIIAVVCAIFYMIIAYIYPYRSKVEIPGHVEATGKDTEILGGTPKPPPPLAHYTDILTRRQMFKLYEVPKPKPVGPAKPKVTLQQLLAGYTFIGILFGDVPQAIVEEKRSGQSFYLTAGQFIGEIKIEKIERGRITVSYEEETMDISI